MSGRWHVYSGPRIPEPGWRIRHEPRDGRGEVAYAYVWPFGGGQFCAYVEQLCCGEVRDVDLGAFDDLADAKACALTNLVTMEHPLFYMEPVQ